MTLGDFHESYPIHLGMPCWLFCPFHCLNALSLAFSLRLFLNLQPSCLIALTSCHHTRLLMS